MTRSRQLPPTHREAIREIFLRRRAEYSTQDAAQLLRLGLGEYLALVQNGTLDVQARKKRRQLGGVRHALVSWKELASAALLRWTVVQIHDALGEDANVVLPRLFRPIELQAIRLPEYQVRLLESLAVERGVTVEEYVFDALQSLESVAPRDVLERLLPGFSEAMEFPDV